MALTIFAGAHFGFEVTSARTGNLSLQLLEGESAEVCVLLLEPEELQTDMEMGVQLASGEVELTRVPSFLVSSQYRYQY